MVKMEIITKSKKIAREIEVNLAFFFDGKIVNKKYDIETETYLIEVKSCNIMIKNSNNRYTNNKRLGGFWVLRSNHDEMLEIAKDKKKKPIYIFCIKHFGQILYSYKTHKQVSALLTCKGNYVKIPIGKAFNNSKDIETLRNK